MFCILLILCWRLFPWNIPRLCPVSTSPIFGRPTVTSHTVLVLTNELNSNLCIYMFCLYRRTSLIYTLTN